MLQLFESSLTGNIKELKEILNHKIDLNIENKDGTTPLCIVSKCRPDIVKWYLEEGANPNFVGRDKISPLHWAVEYDNEEIISLLLNYGAQPSLVDSFNETPLHWACWTGHLKSARLLIDSGADILSKNHINRTPYDLAHQQEHIDLIEYLNQKLKEGSHV